MVMKFEYKGKRTIRGLATVGAAEKKRLGVVALHGFAGHKESIATARLGERICEIMPESIFICFDLPGHGADGNILNLALCEEYTAAAAEYLKNEYGVERLVLYGTSFGGYLALKYMLEHGAEYEKAAVRCPAVKMYSAFTEKLIDEDDKKTLRQGGTIELGFDRLVTVTNGLLDELREQSIFERDFRAVSDRLLIVQGTADEVVNPDEVKSFAEKNSITLRSYPNADHRFLDEEMLKDSIEAIARFLTV